MTPSRVTVLLWPDDIVTFAKFVAGKNLRREQIIGLIVAVTITALLLTPAYHIQEEGLQIFYLAPIALVGLAMFFSPAYTLRQVRHRAEKEQPTRKPKRFEVRDDGLFHEDDLEQGLLRWVAFSRFLRHDACHYLFTSPSSAIIFPDRCFPTSEDAAVFFNQVLLHLEKAHTPPKAHENPPR